MQPVLPFRRAHAVAGAGAFYAIVQALRSSRPELGALGALAVGLTTSYWTRHDSLHWSAQAALVFLLLHSLRWDESAQAGARPLRLLASALWVLDGGVLSAGPTRLSTTGIAAGAALVLGGWLLRGWLRRDWRGLSLPVASALAAASGPFHWLHQKSSAGIMALVGSLALFAVGTITACTRKPAKGIKSGLAAE
jgi:hypothetical protein